MLKIAHMLSVRARTTIDPHCAVEYVSPAIRRSTIEIISESAIEVPEVDCVRIILTTFYHKHHLLFRSYWGCGKLFIISQYVPLVQRACSQSFSPALYIRKVCSHGAFGSVFFTEDGVPGMGFPTPNSEGRRFD